MLTVPLWIPERAQPPLDFGHALALAANGLRAQQGDAKFRVSAYSLNSVGSRWYYTFQFEQLPNAAALHLHQAIVLMNGTVVEPIISTSVQSQPTAIK